MDIKQKLADFIVEECLVLPPSLRDQAPKQYYYQLEKCGHTTFSVIDKISTFFHLDKNFIGYAGLKDEDGITKQHISINTHLENSSLNEFNIKWSMTESFVRLCYIGAGDKPIKVGELCGNSFRLVVRKISQQLATTLQKQKHYSTFFINYYGTQRFGLPNNGKTTHLIGEYLLNYDYDKAMHLLKDQPNEIGFLAKNSSNAQQFFNELNPKIAAFYQSAYYSHLWNKKIKKLITKMNFASIEEYLDSEIKYLFINDSAEKLQLLQQASQIEYIRVVPNKGEFKKLKIKRNVLVQINLQCNKIFSDDINDGWWAAEIQFFLPSGSYATVAVPQTLRSFCINYNIA
jgi:tRNA pseudouridine13 synthase